MKLCKYVQNNSEIYLAAVTFFNIDLRMDMFSQTDLYIFKVQEANEHTTLRLKIWYWKTFPSMLVVPLINVPGNKSIMDKYFNILTPMDLFGKYAKAIKEVILEINLI
jgi:hypothetical protein